MKRISIFCIIMLLLTLCGCRKELTSDKTLIAGGSSIKAEHTEESKPIEEETEQREGIIYDPDDFEDGTPVNSYNPDDYPNVPDRPPTASTVVSNMSQTVEEIINEVETDGMIVTGHAYGNRISYKNEHSFGTKTQFLIDHVFYGRATSGETITISEGYMLCTDGEDAYLECLSNDHSYLQNNESVLLILRKSTAAKGCYTPAQFALPIGEDCTEWSESYMTSLLDYFRGDKSVYAHPEDYSYTKTVQFKNGETEEMPVYVIAQIWPQKNLSDAEMIAEMQDNLLVYLASEYKIKIWPTEHVNYSGTHCARTVSNMAKWQYP